MNLNFSKKDNYEVHKWTSKNSEYYHNQIDWINALDLIRVLFSELIKVLLKFEITDAFEVKT